MRALDIIGSEGMSRNPIVTDRSYNIHYYEVDIHKRALMTSIINYLGDMAMYQSEILGVGRLS